MTLASADRPRGSVAHTRTHVAAVFGNFNRDKPEERW